MEDSRAASSAALGVTAAPAWPPGGPAPWRHFILRAHFGCKALCASMELLSESNPALALSICRFYIKCLTWCAQYHDPATRSRSMQGSHGQMQQYGCDCSHAVTTLLM